MYAEIAVKRGYLYGSQLPRSVYFPLHFADQDFKKPRYTAYINALAKHRPQLASVLDWEHEHRFDEIMMRAQEVSQYTNEVMIIPKVIGGVHRIPREVCGKPVRLGYSVPTGFGGTNVPTAEFAGWPVHLLGGEPGDQMEYAKRMKVVSADCNSHMRKAGYGEFWAGYRIDEDGKVVDTWKKLRRVGLGHIQKPAPFAFTLSCINIRAWWQGCRAWARWAHAGDVDAIKRIAQQYRDELGFVNRAALLESIQRMNLFVALVGKEIVGFANYRARRDGMNVIYEIAADKAHRGQGIGRLLFEAVPSPRRLKCTVDNPANGFYRAMGMEYIGQEAGKKRALNVWEMTLIA